MSNLPSTQNPNSTNILPASTALSSSPYKGLDPYTSEDANFFFGRDGERDIIISNLRASRLTLLYGVSGVGKSSVLRAGVEATLLGQAQTNLSNQGFPEFTVVVFTDWSSEDLIAALASRIEQAVKKVWPGRYFAPLPPTHNLLELLQVWTNRLDGEIFLIFDQFEEYFLYHGQEQGQDTFENQFPRVINYPQLPVSFLVSIREDSYTKLDCFKGRIPQLFSNYLRLDYLNGLDAQSAIEKPLEIYNQLIPATTSKVIIEPGLRDRLLYKLQVGRILIGEKDADTTQTIPTLTQDVLEQLRIETPYLQLVLESLWQQEQKLGSTVLRLQTLTDTLGGEAKIVQSHLDEAMLRFKADEEIIAVMFDRLVTPSGTKIALTLDELAEYVQLPPARLQPILENLATERILRPVVDPLSQLVRYEILHDVLAASIIDWRKRFQQRQKEESMRRRNRTRNRVVGAGIFVLLVVLAIITFLAVSATNANIEANRQAESAKNNAARYLALQSQNFTNSKQYDLGLLLGVEAMQTSYLPESRNSLLLSQFNNPNLATYLHGHTNYVTSLAFSPDSKILASASADNTIILWDTSDYHQLIQLTGHKDAVNSIAFSPVDKILASGSNDKTIILWDVVSGKPSKQLMTQTSPIISIAFNPDGKTLASGSSDNVITLWDVPTGQELTIIKGSIVFPHNLAFSPDGRTLAASGNDNSIILWDSKTGQQISKFKGHAGLVHSIAYTRDGKNIISGSEDNSIILWDAVSGQSLGQLKGISTVDALAISPDGETIAVGGKSNTITIGDLKNGKQSGLLNSGGSAVYSLAFNPDNSNILASAGTDKSIAIWNLEFHFLVQQACKLASRNLTKVESLQFFDNVYHTQTCSNLPPGQ